MLLEKICGGVKLSPFLELFIFVFNDEFLPLFVGFINWGFGVDKFFAELSVWDFEVDLMGMLVFGVCFWFALVEEVLDSFDINIYAFKWKN